MPRICDFDTVSVCEPCPTLQRQEAEPARAPLCGSSCSDLGPGRPLLPIRSLTTIHQHRLLSASFPALPYAFPNHLPVSYSHLVVSYPRPMSFLASHQRGYDSLSHPDLPPQPPIHPAHPSRHPMHPLSSYDNLPLPPFASVSAPSMASNPANPPYLSDRPHIALPKLGETRCCESSPSYPSDRSSIELTPEPCSVPMLTLSRDRARLVAPHLAAELCLPRPCPRQPSG